MKKKVLLLLLPFTFILAFSVNSFAAVKPQVNVDAPKYVEKGRPFHIDVHVTNASIVNKVCLENVLLEPKVHSCNKATDQCNYRFAPITIKKDTIFKVIVRYNGYGYVGRWSVIENVTVKVKH